MTRPSRIFTHVRAALTSIVWLIVVAGVPAAAAIWALRSPENAAIPSASPPDVPAYQPSTLQAVEEPPMDPRVLTVTLVDDLFPQPPEPPPPPPEPKLRLQLIAISRSGNEQRIFVKDEPTGVYLDLGVGDCTPGGVTVLAIDERGATFEMPISHHSDPIIARLELDP